jgi:nitrogen fixation NifU-like protein
VLSSPTARVRRASPQCGDVIELTLKLGDRVEDLAWSGQACLLGAASASMMGDLLIGLSIDDARQRAEELTRYLDTFRGKRFAAFACVRSFPVRRGCVELPWQALSSALQPRRR